MSRARSSSWPRLGPAAAVDEMKLGILSEGAPDKQAMDLVILI
jgi:hypothetical protein